MRLNLQEYLTVHRDGELFKADCEITAVRIRTVGDHKIWPYITRTTLLFSSEKKYYTVEALDQMDLTGVYGFHKTIQPRYG